MHTVAPIPGRYPINGTFELTLRCNLQCSMCMFRHAACENADMMGRELTAQQWIEIARQAHDAGTLNLLITGGEPLLRRDFTQIYEGIYQLGFLMTLYTNATLVTPQILRTLQKYPPHRIGITLYGASNETYEKVCGCADGFDRAMAGIEMLKTLPSVLDFRMTLTKDNVHDARLLEQLVHERFGGYVTQTAVVFQSVRGGCARVQEVRLPAGEMLRQTVGRTIDLIKKNIPPELVDKVQLRLKDMTPECTTQTCSLLGGCSAGMESYTVTWDGKLLGCQMLGAFSTDVVKEGFVQAWDRFPFTVRLPKINEECAACSLADKCRICPAVCMAETGTLNEKPDYICAMTKAMENMKEGAL